METYGIGRFAEILKTNAFDDGRVRAMRPGADGTITVNLTGLTKHEVALARDALAAWEAITSLDFVEVTGKAQITYSNAGDSARTTTRYSDGTIKSAEVVIGASRVDPGDGIGSYVFRTYMHETGHALGLGHPQDYGKVKEFGQGGIANDSWQMSILSYFDQNENTVVNATKAYNLTPMVADYVAIRGLYGAAPVREGNTVYGVGSTAGGSLDQAAKIGAMAAFLIADTGGRDTVSFSIFQVAQRIDLREGAISNVMGGVGNMQIAPGTVIENATGGLASDVIIGNDRDNVLNGGGGTDELIGGRGNDTYIIDGGDRVVEAKGAGIDRVISSADYILAQGVENLTLSGKARSAIGNAEANVITGTSGADRIDGQGGADRLIGGSGDDSYVWRKGATIVEHMRGGNDTVFSASDIRLSPEVEKLVLTGTARFGTGNVSANVITGNASANVIDGDRGADTLAGGAGNDIYLIGAGDRVVERAGEGHDRMESARSFNLVAAVEDGRLTGAARVSLDGNSLGNRLEGNANANRLAGFAGDDRLSGGAGADTLDGGAGNDALFGGAGADRFVFADGRDQVMDFSDEIDRIALSRSALGLGSLADALAAAKQVGNAVVFDFGLDRLVVNNIHLADLRDDVILI